MITNLTIEHADRVILKQDARIATAKQDLLVEIGYRSEAGVNFDDNQLNPSLWWVYRFRASY